MFLYRHCLELELKYIISIYGPTVSVAPIWNSHNLVALWQAFERVLEGYGVEGDDSANPVVRGIVVEFAKIDPQSFSYRYPCDTNGNVIPVDQNALHLETLKDVMDGVFGFFTGCDGYLNHINASVP